MVYQTRVLSRRRAREREEGREREMEKKESGRKEVSIMKFVLRHLFIYVSTKVRN